MAMETRLSLRQSQRVVMTPLLQQAIQLLQLSTLELQEVVQKELLENPLLEEVQPETAEQPEGKDAPPDVPTAPPTEPLSSEAAPAPTTERQTDDLPFDLTAVMFDDHEERSLVAQEDREDLPFENMVRSVSSLTDHLDEQLRYASDDPLVRRIARQRLAGRCRRHVGRRVLAFRLLGRLGLHFLEERILEELLLHDFLQLEGGQLQQLDGLLQQRRHDDSLALSEGEARFHCHGSSLPGT